MPSSAGHTILAWVAGAVVLVGAGALVGAYIAGRPSGEALALLLDGVDLKGAKMRPWYQRE